ncbi:GNAT family N-acetyltransferase [Tsuneonella mangrovi]|uniref:GNAT family N-acetyltransferase n=1 Tax=Tsuneonella mangrovi TaxID=1982042 RepID=UPI000BA1F9CE|nr:GNAT family N-acetyltransferase [Tsuneonella mangrovi]
MILRHATQADAAALADFARDAFAAAFAQLYKPEDLAAFFADWRSEEIYAKAIGDPDTTVTLAEEDGRILAYSLIKRDAHFDERPEPRPAHPTFLSQLYCAYEATGRGLGAALMDKIIADARAWESDALQLSVFSENFGAQRFYQRYGFEKVADIDFWVGNHRDDEFLYELKL